MTTSESLRVKRIWVFAVVVATLMSSHANVLGDWKSALARKAVGRAARAGIEEAVEDAVKDAAFEEALVDVGRQLEEARRRATLDSTAGEAFEAAMTAADIASSLDAAADIAEAARKINKVRKVISKVK